MKYKKYARRFSKKIVYIYIIENKAKKQKKAHCFEESNYHEKIIRRYNRMFNTSLGREVEVGG